MAVQPRSFSEIESSLSKSLQKFLIAPPSGVRLDNLKSMTKIGAQLRDKAIWDFPLVNDAANAYQDLASTREWTVSGKELPVSRTIEALNNATSWDFTNGMVDVGFEQYLRRRSLDHILVGRTAFGLENVDEPAKFQLSYLDPTKLFFQQLQQKTDKRGLVAPVKPESKVWSYGFQTGEPMYRWMDVKLNHSLPVGYNGFVSPFLLVYPTALMAWLLQEHDTNQLNGRKLRDIIIVNKGLYEPIVLAMEQALALASGGDPTQTGIPIVETGQVIQGILQDSIATLKLSNIPETFDRAGFDHMYANQIAGAFGLALRQFWQDDSNTNRALEEVQEARQQLKGPLAFVRAEQRLINDSAIVRIFSPRNRPSRFAFQEESDSAGLKNKAEAIKLFSEALYQIAQAVGARLRPEVLLRKAQQYDLLPADVPIEDMLLTAEEVQAAIEMEQAQVKDNGDIAQSPDSRTNDTTEVTSETTLKAIANRMAVLNRMKGDVDLDYDDVKMSRDGIIIERRVRVFDTIKSLEKALAREPLASNAIKRYDDENEGIEAEDDDGDQGTLFLEGLSGEPGGE